MIGFLDIETCSLPDWLWNRALEECDDPEVLRTWLRRHAGDGALSPWTGWVCCWALAGEGDRVWSWSGEDEGAGLRKLLDVFREAKPHPIVTHNGNAFDIPFLRVRALSHGLTDLARLLHQDKPWSGRLVDTADPSWVPRPSGARKGWEYSLDAVAALLGVERPPTLPGREVPLAAFEGRWDEIRTHCIDDVVTLRRVYPVLAAGRAA